jgi:hypothetical protein
MTTSMELPKRIVGKRMVDKLYIHRSAAIILPKPVRLRLQEAFEVIKGRYGNVLPPTIIKITDPYRNTKTGEHPFTRDKITFLWAPGFDTEREPQVYSAIIVYPDNNTQNISLKSRNLIYHHKWMFVEDDYPGFDVAESKRWSEFWMQHPRVKAMRETPGEHFSSKIGNKKYWEETVTRFIEKEFEEQEARR